MYRLPFLYQSMPGNGNETAGKTNGNFRVHRSGTKTGVVLSSWRRRTYRQRWGTSFSWRLADQTVKRSEKHRLHTAIETCGYASYEVLKEAINYLDVIFFDIKSMNDEKHKRYTGKSNQIILDNFKQLVQDAKTTKITARTPVIPGFNDTVEEIEEIQRFVAKGKNVSYEMLPYHRFGKGKYEMLGRTYPMGDVLLSEEIKTYIQKQNEKWRKKECQS